MYYYRTTTTPSNTAVHHSSVYVHAQLLHIHLVIQPLFYMTTWYRRSSKKMSFHRRVYHSVDMQECLKYPDRPDRSSSAISLHKGLSSNPNTFYSTRMIS